MNIFAIFLLIKFTVCEQDKRIITTLKYSKYHVMPTVVNGQPSKRGNLPYLVSIKEPGTSHSYSDHVLWLPLCGGSIISLTKVLTAAHCFEGKDFFYKKRPDLLRLVAGNVESTHFHSGETETTDEAQWRKIDKVNLHSQFSFPDNDIAVVNVDVPWNFTVYVNYATPASINGDYPSTCYTAGFGRTRYDHMKSSLTPVLLQARIDIIPAWKCSAIWGMDMANKICTDSAVADVSTGDSGGPLGCRFTLDPAEEPGRDVLVGVVSGKNFDLTSLFTRVSRYRAWIDGSEKQSLRNSARKLFARSFVLGTCMCSCCVVVCEHCQAPVGRQEHPAVLQGHSYHQECRKCYVCSETDLQNAEVFKGVIFCSSCSQRIFQGVATARNTKETSRKHKERVRRRRSPRTRGKANRKRSSPHVIALTELIASSGTSEHCSTTSHSKSKSIVMPTEMALTTTVPQYDGMTTYTKNSAEMGMTTEVTQQLLNELHCPVVTRYKKATPVPSPSFKVRPHKKKSPCSDLRIAELGTSREIANMALRHKNEPPNIIVSHSPAKQTSYTSDSVLNKESESGDQHDDEWQDSAYSTLDGKARSSWIDRRFQSIVKIPFFAFKNNILRRSSLISNLMSEKESMGIIRKMKAIFHKDYDCHRKRGVKRLYSTINRKQERVKLGWLNLASNVYDNHNNVSLRQSNNSKHKRCRHFTRSHSYRCMRAQVMRLAGPTKSELAVIRGKIKNIAAPGFLRNVAITYCKKPAMLTSHACGASIPSGKHED